MNMGNTCLKPEKYQEAIENDRQVKKLRPAYAITSYNLGVAYFKQNLWAKAEKEFNRALALNPKLLEAQKSLNLVRKKMKLG